MCKTGKFVMAILHGKQGLLCDKNRNFAIKLSRRPSGFYAYMESSSPVQPGDKARLLSHIVTRSSRDNSITFWYHMHGIDMGTLNVYLKRGSTLGAPVIRLSGNVLPSYGYRKNRIFNLS